MMWPEISYNRYDFNTEFEYDDEYNDSLPFLDEDVLKYIKNVVRIQQGAD